MTCLAIALLLTCDVLAEDGRLQNAALSEASGLARSHRSEDLYWAINDGGHAPLLFAIDAQGFDRGQVVLQGASNRDWEDIASYVLGDRAMLLVADIGDNLGVRPHLTLYGFPEPLPGDEFATPEWTLNVSLPGGSADAEAIAVDVATGRILLLSKREIPAVLYSLPLPPAPEVGDVVEAVRLMELASLPQPTDEDRLFALPRQDWHWQPTAMDISDDGLLLAVLTYRAVYVYKRDDQEDWVDALRAAATRLAIADLREAEALAIAGDGQRILVTVEAVHGPVRAIPVPGVATR